MRKAYNGIKVWQEFRLWWFYVLSEDLGIKLTDAWEGLILYIDNRSTRCINVHNLNDFHDYEWFVVYFLGKKLPSRVYT